MTPPRKEYNNRSECHGEETLSNFDILLMKFWNILTKSMDCLLFSDLAKGLFLTLLIFQLWLLNIITLFKESYLGKCVHYILTNCVTYFYSCLLSALDKKRVKRKGLLGR